MKRLMMLLGALAFVTALTPLPLAAQSNAGVTGVGAASLPSGAMLYDVSLSTVQFGLGARLPGGGAATGTLDAQMVGTSVYGQRQTVALDGQVSRGTTNADGSVTFSGQGFVDLPSGQTLADVPFSVTAGAGRLALTVGGTTLPAATVTEGSITIQAQ
jgi:hypothetical protein